MSAHHEAYFNNYGCNMQFGGDDQWSNMLAGTDLIRRKTGADAYAVREMDRAMKSRRNG